MLCFLSVILPVNHPRCVKLTIVYLLFSNFNLSKMLEFDDSWKLMTTRIFPILLGIVPDEKPFTNFLSLSCFSIITDDSSTSIPISLTNPHMSLSFSNNWGSLLLNFEIPDTCLVRKIFNLRDSFLLILESWMSSHVMYGSARCMCKS